MSRMLKLKARYYLIMFLVMIVLDVLLCIYTFYQTNKTLNTILLIVSFVLTGLFFDIFIQKVFEVKRRKDLYKEHIYTFDGLDNLKEALTSYTVRDLPYGLAYSKVNGIFLYKITVIDNIKEYHSFDPEKYSFPETPGVSKAKKMIGVEIFVDVDDALVSSIAGYSISTEKIMYTALYLKDDKLVEANHLEPFKMLNDEYKKMLDMVGVRDEESNTL